MNLTAMPSRRTRRPKMNFCFNTFESYCITYKYMRTNKHANKRTQSDVIEIITLPRRMW